MTAGRRISLVCWLLPCVFLCACRNNNHQLLENELRAKESLYRETLHELKRIEAQNEALQREIASFRQAPGPPLPPEVAAPTFGLKRVTLGRGTGGYDNDGLPGDEALQVVLEPRDGDDHVVKVPAALHVTAVEVNAQGLKNPLCWWTLTPEQLRPNWKQGLLSTGYILLLPWTVQPQCENVRVVAQLKLADGRVFEADKDVKVRLASRTAPLPVLPPTMPQPTMPQPTMPQPQPVLPGPNPFITPSGGVQDAPTLRWSPAPLTDAVDLGRPQPLPGGGE